jgi:hypothetical protein
MTTIPDFSQIDLGDGSPAADGIVGGDASQPPPPVRG